MKKPRTSPKTHLRSNTFQTLPNDILSVILTFLPFIECVRNARLCRPFPQVLPNVLRRKPTHCRGGVTREGYSYLSYLDQPYTPNGPGDPHKYACLKQSSYHKPPHCLPKDAISFLDDWFRSPRNADTTFLALSAFLQTFMNFNDPCFPRLTNITKLSLSGDSLQSRGFPFTGLSTLMKKCPSLTSLRLINCQYYGWKKECWTKYAPNLTSLDLRCSTTKNTYLTFELSTHLQSLRALSIKNLPTTLDVSLPNLEHLSLSWPNLVAYIYRGAPVPKQYGNINFDGPLFSDRTLSGCKNVKKLTMTGILNVSRQSTQLWEMFCALGIDKSYFPDLEEICLLEDSKLGRQNSPECFHKTSVEALCELRCGVSVKYDRTEPYRWGPPILVDGLSCIKNRDLYEIRTVANHPRLHP